MDSTPPPPRVFCLFSKKFPKNQTCNLFTFHYRWFLFPHTPPSRSYPKTGPFRATLLTLKGPGGEGIPPPPPLGFLPFTQKIFRRPIPEISWLFLTVGCWYPYKKKSKNFVYTLWHQFWDNHYKNIFLFLALIKKIFLQALVEINFRYH